MYTVFQQDVLKVVLRKYNWTTVQNPKSRWRSSFCYSLSAALFLEQILSYVLQALNRQETSVAPGLLLS